MAASALNHTSAVDAVRCNVADRLTHFAGAMPEVAAVVRVRGSRSASCTFAELEADATALARGLVGLGVQPGTRLVLLVSPGVEFVKLVFALLRSGATTVLVDPGMGSRRLIDCLAGTAPDGFIAVSRAQAVRTVLRRRFPEARLNVTLGPRLFWGGLSYRKLLQRGGAARVDLPVTRPDDPAAIIFTSGSTGPPKGVLYTHRMFDTQVAEIQRAYDIQPGGVDLACFALFGLFNSAMGVTTVFPDMNFSRPASAKPRKLLAAANQWQVTQAFASPSVWDKLSRHCEETGERIPTLRKVFSCGAPVAADVLSRTLACVHPDAEMHTPYGATEALPVSTIEAREVLDETGTKTAAGAGVCVGRKFDSVDWRVVRITDASTATINDGEELPPGEIGELLIRGLQVTPGYVELRVTSREFRVSESTSLPRNAQLATRNSPWHRMGDVGYLDADGRFWYCGRKSHRVETAAGPLYTEQVEAIINTHPSVRRSALVGVGPRGAQTPMVIVEPSTPFVEDHALDFEIVPYLELARQLLGLAAANPVSAPVKRVLFYPLLPVDVRHNAKINREVLAKLAPELVRRQPSVPSLQPPV